MDPLLIGSLASAGIGLVSQALTNKANKDRSNEANQLTRENLEWQKQQYFDQKSYNEALQKKLFEREDTSYQRTKDDLLAAGYSPLAINGTNDAGTVVGQPSVPELPNINPFQANSLNFGQLSDILTQAQNRKVQERALDIQEEKNLTEKEQREAELKEKQRQFDLSMEQSQNQFDQQMQQKITEFMATDKARAEQLQIERDKVNNCLNAFKLEESKYKTEAVKSTLRAFTGVEDYPIEYIDDSTPEGKQAVKQAQEQFAQAFIKEVLDPQRNRSLMSPTTENTAGSGNIGILGNSVSGQYSNGKSFNYNKAYENEFRKFALTHHFPLGESCRP